MFGVGPETALNCRDSYFNPLKPELNPSAQRCLARYFTGILIFKGVTARRFYKSFGTKGLKQSCM
jgi:hypothetical protein